MNNFAQEKNDLLIELSTLVDKVASAGSERELLQEKVTLLSQEKTATDNELALLKDSLKTSEEEKQVGSISKLAKVFSFLVSYWRFCNVHFLAGVKLLMLA